MADLAVMTEERMATVAAVVLAVVWVLRRVGPGVWARVPERWRWVVPLLIGTAAAVTDSAARGASSRELLAAAVAGVLGGLGASGAHEALKASPLPYARKPDA